MTENPRPEAAPPGDPSPVPDAPFAAEPEEAPNVTGASDGPSEAATADIEERQNKERARDREKGRPPADAPSY